MSGAQSRPLALNNVVYFGTGLGEIVARDFETGSANWSVRAIPQTEVAGANLLVRQGVLIAAGVWTVAGIDAASGAPRWTYTTPPDTTDAGGALNPGQMVGAILDADSNRVYVPAWGASVSAVDVQTGQAAWVWQPGRAASDTAVSVFRAGAVGVRVSGDSVFVSAWHWLDKLGLHSENWMVLLERLTGRELARLTVPSLVSGVSPSGAPALQGDLAIFTGRGGHLWAVDRASWALKWQFTPTPQFLTSTQAEVYGDSVYFDGGDGSLYAISAKDGSLLWKVDAGGSATRGILVTDRRIYYPLQGTLKVYDRMTGTFVAEMSVSDVVNQVIDTPPAFARGRVFIATTPMAQSFDEP